MSPGARLKLLRGIKLFVVFGLPLLGGLYFYQFTGQERDFAVPFETFPSPANQVQDSEGRPLSLPLRENITLVNFWATWCPPCVEEFPAMVELQRELEGKGVEIVFVSVDERWEDVRRFLGEHRIDVAPQRLLWDPSKAVAKAWGSEKFPESYVVRRDGWVLEKIIGAQRWTRPAVVDYFLGLSEKFKGLDGIAKGR